jgi:hypothetical protein
MQEDDFKPDGMSCEHAGIRSDRSRMLRECDHLFHAEHLEVEDEFRVGRNLWWCAFASITEIRGNGQPSLATNSHSSNTDIPSFDDFTDTELEAERFPLLVRYEGWSLAWSHK